MTTFNSTHNRAVWFDIPVADLNRAVAFYRAVLAVNVQEEQFGDVRFAIIEHSEGNGGCLVIRPEDVSEKTGILLYLNVAGRIRDAVTEVETHGGRVLEPVTSIGPHGFRAVVVDSEGNRVALHSEVDG